MLGNEITDILKASKENGWVVEPEAKRLLSLAGINVPKFGWAKDEAEAIHFVRSIGYPVVAKIVSSQIIHKSDVGGVVTNIDRDETLRETFSKFSHFDGFAGILVEEMVEGIELIVGSKNDYQFGPVILLGIGGTGVEIYRDTTLRMAPIREKDVESMVMGLKAHRLLKGYRGSKPVNMQALSNLMAVFSEFVMGLKGKIESIDLNPVICSSKKCVVADARIMLSPEE